MRTPLSLVLCLALAVPAGAVPNCTGSGGVYAGLKGFPDVTVSLAQAQICADENGAGRPITTYVPAPEVDPATGNTVWALKPFTDPIGNEREDAIARFEELSKKFKDTEAFFKDRAACAGWPGAPVDLKPGAQSFKADLNCVQLGAVNPCTGADPQGKPVTYVPTMEKDGSVTMAPAKGEVEARETGAKFLEARAKFTAEHNSQLGLKPLQQKQPPPQTRPAPRKDAPEQAAPLPPKKPVRPKQARRADPESPKRIPPARQIPGFTTRPGAAPPQPGQKANLTGPAAKQKPGQTAEQAKENPVAAFFKALFAPFIAFFKAIFGKKEQAPAPAPGASQPKAAPAPQAAAPAQPRKSFFERLSGWWKRRRGEEAPKKAKTEEMPTAPLDGQ